MAEHSFPTEMVDLPSKGWFYDSDNPLSSGQIELKYMTAKEEDILTNQPYIQNGTVLDKLLESVVVSKVNVKDLVTGDKNSILVATRILGYGSEYNVSIAAVKKYVFASYKMIGSPNRKSDTNLEDISDELKNILLCQLV